MSVINLTDLTTGALNGTGVFDKLISTVNVQVEAQYAAGRINATDYATVYLGALQNTMSQAIQFLLQKEISAKQADLLAAQTINEGKQGQLIDKQIAKITQDILLSAEQVKLTTAQTAKTNADKLVADSENLRIVAQTNVLKAEVLNVPKTGLLIDEQVKKVAQDVLASKADILNTPKVGLKIDADTALSVQQKLNTVTQNELLVAQKDKTDKESLLLIQKTLTELAQINDIAGTTVTGVIGKQKLLYAAQTAGFARDAEQKLLKIMSDSWAVRRSTDSGTIAPSGLSDADIATVSAKAKAGIS